MAKLEKAGIPTVIIDLPDQENLLKLEALRAGVPNIRYVHASRTVPGPADVDNIFASIMEGLTKPLTEKEKGNGSWTPPDQQRILFEGTLDEAQEFYQQVEYVPSPTRANICVYTDGFPIVLPTEERVREMLTGTSHKPDEVISLRRDRTVRSNEATVLGRANASTMVKKKGEPVQMSPNGWTATVEQVAVNAVMAGCKPEHLPVVLAIAESGLPISSTHGLGQLVCVSGPVVKELGFNTGCGVFGPGSPVNSPIGRSYYLMSRNLGGGIPGVTRMNSLEGPFSNGGCCIAENVDGLPPDWEGLNEEFGFDKDQSIVMVASPGGIQHQGFRPGGYRAFQKSGHGGMARRLGVKGVPGPHNWLEYILPGMFSQREHGWTLVMVPEMARHLYEYGFKSKTEIYEWLYKKSFEPLATFKLRSGPDVETNGWMGVEKLSGKHWKELPDDYMVPIMDSPAENCIIVAGGEEETSEQMGGGRGQAYGIDAWR
ncbi:MAG: hypothetical protein HYX80_08390 [Chloroflexi bacterium]|nr:hypothetical protein [Chloroflexota bacterium]